MDTIYHVQVEQGDEIIPVAFPEGTPLADVLSYARQYPESYVLGKKPGEEFHFLYWVDKKGVILNCTPYES